MAGCYLLPPVATTLRQMQGKAITAGISVATTYRLLPPVYTGSNGSLPLGPVTAPDNRKEGVV
jgi:hypothetical protein